MLQCTHGKAVNAQSLTVSCEYCSRRLQIGRDRLRDSFPPKVNSRLRDDLLWLLFNHGIRVTVGGVRAVRIPHVRQKMDEEGMDVSSLQIWDAMADPRVALYDQKTDALYLADPFLNKPKWGAIRNVIGHTNANGAMGTLRAPSQWVAPKHPVQGSKELEEPDQAPLPADSAPVATPGTRYAEVSVDDLVPFIYGQSRGKGSAGFADASLDRLGKSMDAVGQIHNIVICELSPANRLKHRVRYHIVCGERRWRAAKAAGQTTIQARMLPADTPKRTLMLMNLGENFGQVRPGDVEAAETARRLLDDPDLGVRMEDLVNTLQRNPGTIRRILPLATLDPEVRRLARAHPVAFPTSRLLQLVGRDSETQIFLAKQQLERWKTVRDQHLAKPSGGERPAGNPRGRQAPTPILEAALKPGAERHISARDQATIAAELGIDASRRFMNAMLQAEGVYPDFKTHLETAWCYLSPLDREKVAGFIRRLVEDGPDLVARLTATTPRAVPDPELEPSRPAAGE